MYLQATCDMKKGTHLPLRILTQQITSFNICVMPDQLCRLLDVAKCSGELYSPLFWSRFQWLLFQAKHTFGMFSMPLVDLIQMASILRNTTVQSVVKQGVLVPPSNGSSSYSSSGVLDSSSDDNAVNHELVDGPSAVSVHKFADAKIARKFDINDFVGACVVDDIIVANENSTRNSLPSGSTHNATTAPTATSSFVEEAIDMPLDDVGNLSRIHENSSNKSVEESTDESLPLELTFSRSMGITTACEEDTESSGYSIDPIESKDSKKGFLQRSNMHSYRKLKLRPVFVGNEDDEVGEFLRSMKCTNSQSDSQIRGLLPPRMIGIYRWLLIIDCCCCYFIT